MSWRRFLIWALFGVLAAACGQVSEPAADDTTATAVATTVAPATTTTVVTTTTPPTTTAAVDWGAILATWQVSLRSVGPYTIGMSLDEAAAAGGAELVEVEDADPSCSYYTHDPSTGLDRELRFMVRADRVVRIDIDGTQLKTLSGLGNGDTKAALVSTYGDAVIVSASLSGEANEQYVTYIPFDEADADYRLRFETTDDIVTSFRIGRLPEVEWVDRCD